METRQMVECIIALSCQDLQRPGVYIHDLTLRVRLAPPPRLNILFFGGGDFSDSILSIRNTRDEFG